jgi:O-methyltransferase
MPRIKKFIQKTFALVGLKIVRIGNDTVFPSEFSKEDKKIFNFVRSNELSIVSDERLFDTLMACLHVVTRNVEGDFVECGVYRGGNAILAADVFRRSATKRSVWLYDTFVGMTAPTSLDVNYEGVSAEAKFFEKQKADHNDWCYATVEEVKKNFQKASLLDPNVKFIKGDVFNTLSEHSLVPEKISVLRLDTDWYESTKLELEVLYPRLSKGGIIIIDDYGSWGGARKAVDEYFSVYPRPFFKYTDFSRLGVKCE